MTKALRAAGVPLLFSLKDLKATAFVTLMLIRPRLGSKVKRSTSRWTQALIFWQLLDLRLALKNLKIWYCPAENFA